MILVNDATVLLRDIAGDAAQKTATRINPSDDALKRIDEPAEDNTWHDVPNLSPANLKSQARDAYGKNKPFGKGDLKAAAGNASESATGTRDPTEAATTAQDSGADARGGAAAAASNLTNAASDNVPEETKDKARNFKNRTSSYVGEKIPKERRDVTILRLKKMIVEIQSHSDCKVYHTKNICC